MVLACAAAAGAAEAAARAAADGGRFIRNPPFRAACETQKDRRLLRSPGPATTWRSAGAVAPCRNEILHRESMQDPKSRAARPFRHIPAGCGSADGAARRDASAQDRTR